MLLRRVLAVLVLLAWNLVVIAAHAVGETPPAPRRIVSLNLCTDQLVLALADRAAVRSVTWLARDPQSAVLAAAAAEVPVNHGLAEEIIPLAPDLVVAGLYTARTTVVLLKRFGFSVLELDVPDSLPAIAAQIRTVAHALGHPERGEAMVTALLADLTALGPVPPEPWPVAVVYHPNGFTGGRGSLIDDLLTRAGLRNLATERALTHYGRLSLDLLLLGRPDLLILNTQEDRTPSLAQQVLRHPGLAKAFPHLHTLVVPPRLWSCGGPWVVEAIAQLRTAAPGGAGGTTMTPASTTGRIQSPRAMPSHGWLLTGLTLLVLVLFVISLAVGRAPLPVRQALDDVLHGRTTLASLVLLEIRLPRALLGLLVGMSLGLAGAAMQGLLRNPLAEPGIVGVSGCAAFGAVLAFYTGLSITVPLALPLGGIAGALLAVGLLALLTGRQASTLTLILAGVALNSLAGALTALALNLFPNPYAVVEIIFWLMGSLADRSLQHVLLVLPLMLVGWGLVLRTAHALDGLTLGEDTARSLGVRLGRLQLQLVVGTALAVGSAVAVTGTIGFVGLVVPHLLRPLVGSQPSRLLLPSALGGAALTLAADSAVRLLTIGPELKLGVVTALLGAPFFLALLHRLRRETL